MFNKRKLKSNDIEKVSGYIKTGKEYHFNEYRKQYHRYKHQIPNRTLVEYALGLVNQYLRSHYTTPEQVISNINKHDIAGVDKQSITLLMQEIKNK